MFVIDNDKLDYIEEIAINWQYERMGSFYKSLMKTISLADVKNQNRLMIAYPYHTRAYNCFSTYVGWWDAVEKKARKLNIIC